MHDERMSVQRNILRIFMPVAPLSRFSQGLARKPQRARAASGIENHTATAIEGEL
jgi:hypothetical protein